MPGGFDPGPALLAEPAQREDRLLPGRLEGRGQYVGDLLGDRPMLLEGAPPKPAVEAIREVLDVQRRHEFLQLASIMEAWSRTAAQIHTHWCIIPCVRTNLVLNDELLGEAMRLSAGRSKRAVVEEALRTYVAVKRAERTREGYRQRLQRIAERLRGLKLGERPSDVLRADRDRR